jgi:DNA-directed RNA polymerase specialized sigma24 family protein
LSATETGSSSSSSSSRTNWALIYDAAHGDPLPATEAIEKLVRRYWPAVYAYIRRSGRDVHEASDLTQGFVCDVILGRGLFSHADPQRGRFRALLMRSLANYLHERHRHDTRDKRSAGGVQPLSLENAEIAASQTAWTVSPEHAFLAQWNAMIIRDVVDRVHEGCMKSGLEAHWQVFEARVVRPMLFNEPRIPYAALVERLELTDSAQAANMMITVKRRFVHALVQEVARTVGDPMQVEEELRELIRDLERHA